jgi:hypothetical protein
LKAAEEFFAISIVMEDASFINAPDNYMMDGTGIINSALSRHND